MKYWEFLIQKEGDQTWLPLETQQVEILEGRYRVVAHTDRANTPVDIRVSQLMTDEMPPRQRVRKRTSSTNESGLVVVMPFVHLKPGQWKLQCSSVNSVEDLLGGGWQYGVALQVFAQSEDSSEDGWPVTEAGQSVSSVLVDESDVDGSLVNADLPLLQAQAELQQTVDEQSGDTTNGSGRGPSAKTEDDLVYQVILKQQAYLAQRDQPMTIVGKVNSLTKSVQDEASQLWIRLQNPETAGVIMEAHRPLSLARLPADFRVQIQLPNDVKTRVVLGEVSLRTAAIEDERPATVLAATAFTITAGIDQILDAIANQDSGIFEEEVSLLADTRIGFEETSTSEPTVEPTVPSFEANGQKAVVPAASTILPPKLDRQTDAPSSLPPKLDRPELDQPELDRQIDSAPSAANVGEAVDVDSPAVEPVVMPPMVSAPAQFVGTSIEDSDLEADEISAVLEDIDKDLRDEPSELEALEAPGIEGVIGTVSSTAPARTSRLPERADDFAVPSSGPSENRSEKRPSRQNARKSGREVEANIAFQSLKMKDHFWQRLSTLTRQSHEEATKLAAGMDAAGVRRQRGGNNSALSPLSSPESSYSDSEVVIYDEPSGVEDRRGRDRANIPTSENYSAAKDSNSDLLGKSRPGRSSQAAGGMTPQPMQSAEAQSGQELPEMALPVISLPAGDLVAGRTVTVTVRSRPSTYKPFIKLWMIDRQSRSLVIDPKILTNLMPDALGDLQGTTEMQVPMDCLDVQIAAVAIDMATQQESGKAVVNRHVVPANQVSSRGRFKF